MNLGSVSKLRRLSWGDRALLAEALAYISAARVLVALVRFRNLASLLSRPAPAGVARDPDALVEKVRWAVQVWAARVPWRALCFEQGLCAHLMLRRRGIDSVLYYGAAPNIEGRLAAHVWVRYRGTDVIGGEGASQFAVLATFPPQPGAAA